MADARGSAGVDAVGVKDPVTSRHEHAVAVYDLGTSLVPPESRLSRLSRAARRGEKYRFSSYYNIRGVEDEGVVLREEERRLGRCQDRCDILTARVFCFDEAADDVALAADLLLDLAFRIGRRDADEIIGLIFRDKGRAVVLIGELKWCFDLEGDVAEGVFLILHIEQT